jgi:hypothetical protein
MTDRRGTMIRKKSFGLCRLFRTCAIGRAAVRLCLLLLMANLVAPLAWGTAQGGASLDGFALCHAAAGESSSDQGQPADHRNASVVPHCPLCRVHGGGVWLPPSSVPEILRTAQLSEDRPPIVAGDRPRGRTIRLRPSPRAPPVSA